MFNKENEKVLADVKNITGKNLWCNVPFTEISIFPKGDVYTCCPDFVNGYKWGNIYENTYDEIFNGNLAIAFRQSVINSTFEFCNLNMCVFKNSLKNDLRFKYFFNAQQQTLKRLNLNLDETCNVRCVSCRDNMIRESEETFLKKKKAFENIIMPILQNNNIEEIFIDGCGEVFVSKLSKYIIKKITKNFPSIKFIIITNGTLFNEKMYNSLNLKNKVSHVNISIHAATKETYEKIVRGGNFDKLKSNIDFLVNLKNKGEIENINFNFVVSSINYKEMIDFQKWANDLNVNTHFSSLKKWTGTDMCNNKYLQYTVFNPEHPEYNEFKKIVKNKIFQSKNCLMSDNLANN